MVVRDFHRPVRCQSEGQNQTLSEMRGIPFYL